MTVSRQKTISWCIIKSLAVSLVKRVYITVEIVTVLVIPAIASGQCLGQGSTATSEDSMPYTKLPMMVRIRFKQLSQPKSNPFISGRKARGGSVPSHDSL